MDPEDQITHINDMIAKIKSQKGNVKSNTTEPARSLAQKKSITQAPPPPRATPAGGTAGIANVLDPSMRHGRIRTPAQGGETDPHATQPARGAG